MIDLFDSLTNWLLTNLAFFASGLGLLTIGAIALLIILLWDWRLTLLGLLAVQIGVVVLVTKVYQLPVMWSNVQLLVTAIIAAMLALSAHQVTKVLHLRRPGSWLVRLSAVTLLIIGWQFVDLAVPLPVLTPQIAQLFLWLTVCSLVLMGLSDSPLYTGVALQFWFIPVQVLIEILLPGYGLFVYIGIVELVVGLTCSYLLLAQRQPAAIRRQVLSDIVFPIDTATMPTTPQPGWSPKLENRIPVRSAVDIANRATQSTLPPLPSASNNENGTGRPQLSSSPSDVHEGEEGDREGEQNRRRNGAMSTGEPL